MRICEQQMLRHIRERKRETERERQRQREEDRVYDPHHSTAVRSGSYGRVLKELRATH